jgi:predicted TIM-barrel fold metal-dependent hydrolase
MHRRAYLSADEPLIGVADLGPRDWKIVDIHEHLQSALEADRLLVAMDRLGVRRTCIMGSTTYTLTLNPAFGFEGFKENNEVILAIKKGKPDRFCAFVTINPLDEGNLALLQDYVARGADGLKLYLGHGGSTGKGPFHSMRLDDPRMEPIFAWAEKVQLPIVLHVNLEKYWGETLALLEKHPYLRVNLPHFGLEKTGDRRLKRLAFLLDRYPNVYTDVSGGYYTFETDSFEVLAMSHERSRAFFEAHGNKIMYGADMVLEPHKDDAYIVNTMRSYMQFLENGRWRYFLVPNRVMYGLGLDSKVLGQIYEQTPRAFLLLDKNGGLPDRTHGWPIRGVRRPPRAKLPLLKPESIP